MSIVRSGLLSKVESEDKKVDEAKIDVTLKEHQLFSKSIFNSTKLSFNVSRWKFNLTA